VDLKTYEEEENAPDGSRKMDGLSIRTTSSRAIGQLSKL
jgi:hypothetical protein